ncbi:MAG: hypothetical protein Q4E24_06635 [bacterium]|nr:hypothetical protein [bacterium]
MAATVRNQIAWMSYQYRQSDVSSSYYGSGQIGVTEHKTAMVPAV